MPALIINHLQGDNHEQRKNKPLQVPLVDWRGIRDLRLELSGHGSSVTGLGFFQGASINKAKQRLNTWLEKEDLKTEGDFIVAGNISPWVSGFLTRNEVMISIITEEN